MDISIQMLICLVIIVVSVIVSVKTVMQSTDISDAIMPIIGGCSTIITFFIILGFYDWLNSKISGLISKYLPAIMNNGIVHLGAIIIAFIAMKMLIENLLRLINSFSFNSSITKLKNHKPFLMIFSTVFGVIRGMVVIILICIPLALYNSVSSGTNRIAVLDNLTVYNKMEKFIDAGKIKNISNGLLENVSANKISYYNGVTLDEGVASNSSIDNRANEITKSSNTDRQKARAIYTWVGSNIKYDDNKAVKVMNQEKGYESGSIPAFRDRSGICFDYACLFTSMTKAIDLKSRIIIGEGFNGSEFVSHAWNQVYLEDEGIWINVDPTFYVAGDYFDNSTFDNEHKMTSIAGEF
ncbi:transglutaminase-like domain-containing protein [Clostridium vincentii]|uniref:Transglutaminase-like superfamily protein n=1 Tax=Clostridium vincentii TaxID=52704 RepID=A0A2T0BDH3_9CLOT|nr:transglutaminase-like domain-containing protein [Clostridium vincentii]PRR81951.1 Transglutaminase-like superfamily protein [Clostridium vincentii]